MDITRYQLVQEQDGFTLVIYLDPNTEEFSAELGRNPQHKASLQAQIQRIIQEKFPYLNIKAAKVMAGTLLVSTIYLGATMGAHPAAAATQVDATSQYVIYQVQSGDSLSVIAKKFNVTVTDIKSVNGLTTDVIRVGQNLKIPKQVTTTTTTTTYTVVSGDTLSIIAKKFGTSSQDIKTLNKLTTDTIRVGQKLLIPTVQTQTTTSTPAPAPTVTTTTYTVVSGDSLSLIAKRFNTTVTDLKTTNHLTSDTIQVGQKLTIPVTTVATPDSTAPTAPVLAASAGISTSNQTRYTIAGSAEANSSVTVTLTDGVGTPLSLQLKADATGKFSTTVDVSKLADGMITIKTTATDAAGNRSSESQLTVKKDTSATEPVIDNKQVVTPDNVKSYTIFGLSESGANVEISISDGVNAAIKTTATANETGEFRTNVDLHTLKDGTLTITARTIDPSGNSSANRSTTITKETLLAAPVIENAKLVNSQNAANYLISGTGLPNTAVKITVSDGISPSVTASAVTNGDGQFQVNMDLRSLRDQTLTITAVQTNPAGQASNTGTASVGKDTTAPVAPIFNNSNYINKDSQSSFLLTGRGEANTQVNIKATDGTGKTITAQGQVTAAGEYRLSIDLASLNDGDVRFEISLVDSAGNLSPVTAKTLQKDTLGPDSLQIAPTTSIFSGNVTNYILSGTAEPGITLSVLATDGLTNQTKTVTTDSNGRFQVPINLSTFQDGKITFSFNGTDAAGNTSKLASIVVTKDTTAPKAAVLTTAPYVNSLNQGQFSINGTSVEEGGQVQIAISDGITSITKTVSIAGGKFAGSFDVSSLKEGSLKVTITQTDQSGNTGAVQSSTIIKDTQAAKPTVSKNGFNFTNQQSTYTVIGTAEANATVSVSLQNADGQTLITKTAKADATGYYSIAVNLTEEMASAAASASVTQTDLAGNVSEVAPVPLYSYTVATGDTLDSIAQRYHTTVDAIKSLNHLTSDVITPNQVLRLPVSASEVLNLGYMYFGSTSNYANEVNQTASSINTVSPSYFDINTNGTLKLTSSLDASFIAAMHLQGVRVVPFLSNHWDRTLGRAILANKELAAQQIADAVAKYNLDGVNVDIENVTEVDRAAYTEFVRLLREKIPLTKEVSVAVAANPNGWTTGWHGSYDYTSLAKYADYLMIMSYDESYPGGQAGAVASESWVERSIQYALNQNVSPDKIVIGIAQYGRYWIEGQSYGGFGISNWQVDDLVKKYNGTVVFDEATQSPKAIVTIKATDPKPVVGGTTLAAGTYTIWYENAASIQQKLALVSKYNLLGVGNWSIGQESTDVWKSYASLLPTTRTSVSVSAAAPATPTYTTYTVVSGDTLWQLATRNNTTVSAIKELNGLNSDTLYIGQKLKIPAPATTSEPVSGTTTETGATTTETTAAVTQTPAAETQPAVTTTTITYTVVSGDSLSVIAQRFNTTVTAIKTENGLTTDTIRIGQTLTITTTNTTETAASVVSEPVSTPVVSTTPTTYTVVSGDSLSVIAKRFNTTVTAIKTANSLTTDTIRIGQILVIPK